MLQDDALGAAARRSSEPQGPRGCATTTDLDENDIGVGFPLTGKDCSLELAAHEVVRRRIEDEAVTMALQPAGLAGVDHLGVKAGISARLDDLAAGGSLADGAVGPENRDPGRCQAQHLARPES